MKINVDYNILHKAIKKLENHEVLSVKENEAILKLTDATCGDYYPSEFELKLQKGRVEKLCDELFKTNKKLYFNILEQCKEFESKWL